MSDKSSLSEEINQGSMIEDHAYDPRNEAEPWGLCYCGLAEASHALVARPYVITSPRAEKETPKQVSKDRNPVEYK